MRAENRYYKLLLSICAIVIPFYMVYYWEIYESPQRAFGKDLLFKVFFGFSIYLSFATFAYSFK